MSWAEKEAITGRLANAIAPVIERELAAIAANAAIQPPPPSPAKDQRLMKTARAVAAALDDLDQAKFSGCRELAARRLLESRVRALRAALKEHKEPSHG